MITTLVAIAVFIAYGLQQAQQDKGGKPIEQHAPDWQARAGFALFVAGVLTLMHQFYLVAYNDAAIEFGAMAWRFVGLCFVAYGAFTPVFRWRLNRLRGMDARYMGWSNVYDTIFLLIATMLKRPDLSMPSSIQEAYMHRAGFIAYLVELLALLIGCGITLAH